MKMDYASIVRAVIEEQNASPIDMLGIGDASGERRFLASQQDTYIRTVRDVDILCDGAKKGKRILEIGSFLGAVSISLKKMGYDVFALDIPEFHDSKALRSLYEKNGIAFSGVNLRGRGLPFETDSFDLVIACEVIEHLNFNPLPILKEVNRILKTNGYLYVGMPNQARVFNRMNALLGRSIHNGIDDFFKQLDRNDNMIVGLHWREYTLNETVEMVERMGFETVMKYFFKSKGVTERNKIRTFLREAMFLYPPFRPSYVIVGKKVKSPKYDFYITDAST